MLNQLALSFNGRGNLTELWVGCVLRLLWAYYCSLLQVDRDYWSSDHRKGFRLSIINLLVLALDDPCLLLQQNYFLRRTVLLIFHCLLLPSLHRKTLRIFDASIPEWTHRNLEPFFVLNCQIVLGHGFGLRIGCLRTTLLNLKI